MRFDHVALHIDWLTVSQQHESVEDWGSDLVVWYDLETREVQKEVVMGANLEGSWETRLRVRVKGGRVEVSGNPSKWNRPDAVAQGCTSIAEALDVYNRVLAAEGLPLFESRPDLVVPLSDQGVDRRVRQGPRIQWIHIASVLALGAPECIGPFCDWLSTQRVGVRGQPFEVKGPRSLRAGTRRRRVNAVYAKGDELREAAKKWDRKRKVDGSAVSAYLLALADRCDRIGLMRDEVRLAGDYLATVGLQWADDWTGDTMFKQWEEYGVRKAQEVAAVIDWKTEAVSRLMRRGLGERAARSRVETLVAWMGGADVSAGPGRSRAAFYQIAKDLRDALGVDIRSRPNVLTLGSRVQSLARPVQARALTAADVRELYRDLPDLQAA